MKVSLKDDDINHLQSRMKQQPPHLLTFHAYLAYIFELGYDVSIQSSMSVFSNLGFESSIGVFG